MKLLITLMLVLILPLSFNSMKGDSSFLDFDKKIQSLSGKVRLQYLLRIALYNSEHSPKNGEQYSNEALKLAIKLGDKSGEARSLFCLGRSLDFQYKFREGINYYNKALKLFESLDSNFYICKCYQNIGADNNDLGNYSQAIEYYTKAIDISLKYNYGNEFEIYNNLACVYANLGDYSRTIDYGMKSLKIAEKKGDKQKIAYCLNNVALYYSNWKDRDQALNYLNRALKISEEIKDNKMKSVILGNLSNQYSSKKAFLYDSLSLAAAMLANDTIQIARCYYKLSLDQDSMGDKKKSLELKLKHLKILEEIGDRSNITEALFNIGTIYLRSGKFQEALDYHTRSLTLAQEINYRKLIAYNYYNFSEAWFVLRDYQKAYQYLKKYISIKDSIFNEESMQKMQNLKITYETERKDKENADLKEKNAIQLKYFIIILILVFLMLLLLLNRYIIRKKALKLISMKNLQIEEANSALKIKNDQITNQNIELEALNQDLRDSNFKIIEQNSELEELNKDLEDANASKDKFFLILSHELLNPIRWLNNVSDILVKKFDKMEKADLKETIGLLGVSAKESNLLLENLLLWAKIHTDRVFFNPEKINLKELFDENIELVSGKIQDKQIKIELQPYTESLIVADKIMLNTVIRNLLNNAIKFTNPNGTIKIESKQIDGIVNISISDNGVGIKNEDLEKLFKIDVHFTTIGTGKEKGTGLGLILCKEYLEKSGGKIWAKSDYQKGSTFSFSIPVIYDEIESKPSYSIKNTYF